MSKKGRGIFLVYVDIDAQHDKEFNDWFNSEHLPELLAVPGILSAARYVAVKGGPTYLACYCRCRPGISDQGSALPGPFGTDQLLVELPLLRFSLRSALCCTNMASAAARCLAALVSLLRRSHSSDAWRLTFDLLKWGFT